MEHKKAVAKIIIANCGAHCDTWALAGSSRAKTRAMVMRFVVQNPKLPMVKCGVNALNTALINMFEVIGDCIRDREINLKKIIHSFANSN